MSRIRPHRRNARNMPMYRSGLLLLGLVGILAVPAAAGAAAEPQPSRSAAALDCGNGFTMTPATRVSGFNPMLATASELAANDFPSKPEDAALLPVWQDYASAYNRGLVDFGTKCNMFEDPAFDNAPPAGTSTNWCGWVDNGHWYTDAEATWVVPRASGGSSAHASHWAGVGLGGSSTHPVVQAGSHSLGTGYSWGWIEVYPLKKTHEMHLSDFDGIAGHTLFVHVVFHQNIGLFHLVDLTTHIDRNYNLGFTGTTDGHAEFIGERPTHNGALPPLANFGVMGFTQAQTAAPDTGWRPVLKQPRYSLTMVNGGHTLAAPGPGDATGLGYSVAWKAAN